MEKEMKFKFDYEKIVGEKIYYDEYPGPEEQAQRIIPCSILEVTEVGYGNSINIEL